MKYVRFLSKDDIVTTGILDSEGKIKIIQGDLLSEHSCAGKECSVKDIKEYMAPVDIPAIIALGFRYYEIPDESSIVEYTDTHFV